MSTNRNAARNLRRKLNKMSQQKLISLLVGVEGLHQDPIRRRRVVSKIGVIASAKLSERQIDNLIGADGEVLSTELVQRLRAQRPRKQRRKQQQSA